MAKIRVLAAYPGVRVPIADKHNHPVRSAKGALSVTDEGLLYEHSGRLVKGPVEIDDSQFARQQIAEGVLRIVADEPVKPAPKAPAKGGRAND